MNEKLIKCPVCGQIDDVVVERKDCYGCELDYYVVKCDGCGLQFGFGLEFESEEEAVSAWNRRAQPANEPCTDCTGIVYRQTASGKIIPADKMCTVIESPPCYQPDGDGCAYQIYGDNDDEPIDKCKACPLCYSDKVRHNANEPLTLEELRGMDGDPVWCVYPGCSTGGEWLLVNSQGAYKNGNFLNFRYYGEWKAYRRPPERSENDG